jgi:hypothetical protein
MIVLITRTVTRTPNLTPNMTFATDYHVQFSQIQSQFDIHVGHPNFSGQAKTSYLQIYSYALCHEGVWGNECIDPHFS